MVRERPHSDPELDPGRLIDSGEFETVTPARPESREPVDQEDDQPVEVTPAMLKRAEKFAKEKAEAAAEAVSSKKRWQKQGRIFGIEDGGFMVDIGKDKVDLRDVVAFSDELEIVEGKEFGYDYETKQLQVPAKMMDEPSAPIRVLREVIRLSATDFSDNEKTISAERKAREKLAKERKKHEDTYLWWKGHENQAQYEKMERKASGLRMAAEKALDKELAEHLKEFKEEHGIDLEQLEGADQIEQEIWNDLKAEQKELAFPIDEDGKEYLTGEEARGWDKWKGNNEVMQDYRFRRRIGKVPLNRKWANKAYGAGILGMGFAAFVRKKFIGDRVRNFLWKAEKGAWRKAREKFWGAQSEFFNLSKDLMTVFGDWSTGSRKTNLFEGFIKRADKWSGENKRRADKAAGEKTPKSPWEEAEEVAAKYAKTAPKPKKKKSNIGGKSNDGQLPDKSSKDEKAA